MVGYAICAVDVGGSVCVLGKLGKDFFDDQACGAVPTHPAVCIAVSWWVCDKYLDGVAACIDFFAASKGVTDSDNGTLSVWIGEAAVWSVDRAFDDLAAVLIVDSDNPCTSSYTCSASGVDPEIVIVSDFEDTAVVLFGKSQHTIGCCQSSVCRWVVVRMCVSPLCPVEFSTLI